MAGEFWPRSRPKRMFARSLIQANLNSPKLKGRKSARVIKKVQSAGGRAVFLSGRVRVRMGAARARARDVAEMRKLALSARISWCGLELGQSVRRFPSRRGRPSTADRIPGTRSKTSWKNSALASWPSGERIAASSPTIEIKILSLASRRFLFLGSLVPWFLVPGRFCFG